MVIYNMLEGISSILWIITTIIILLVGIYLIFYFHFPSQLISNKVKLNKKIDTYSKFKILNLTLASKIGVGSISGVAVAIVIGGPGTIFWIWISSLLLSFYTFLETKSGIKYKVKKNKEIIGGPQVYIKNILKKPKLSYFYGILIICTYLISFIMIQSNTMINAISTSFYINKMLLTILLIFIIIIIIKKGINSISKIVSVLVPVMGIIYLIIGIYIILTNLEVLPYILNNIVKDAFKFNSILHLPIIIGFQRAVFSNEIGMGTTSMICALSSNDDYIQESKIQILGTCFITLIVCSISAIILLTSNINILYIENVDGMELMNYSFYYHFNNIGKYLLTLIILLFSFSTIITSYYYGKININYLFDNKKDNIIIIIVIIVIYISNYLSYTAIWAIVDIMCSLTTIINLYSLFKIRKELKKE